MFANGTGCRQFATRRALYCDAKDAISAVEVPGMPLASTAPGAPAVDPPIAAGHVGVGAGVGVGVAAAMTGAGVVVNVRPVTLALVDVAATVVACTAVLAAAGAVLDGVVVAAVFGVVPPVDAGVVLLTRSLDSAAEEPLGALDPETTATLARVETVLIDGPAP